MFAMLQFALFSFTFVSAVAAAMTIHWLLLEATLLLMRPAAARKVSPQTELVRGTVQLARAYASHR
jgi:hypothetical protein